MKIETKEETKFVMTILGIFAVLFVIVIFGPLIFNVQDQHSKQLETVNKTCSDHGGVRSFTFDHGFVCMDGTAYKLPRK